MKISLILITLSSFSEVNSDCSTPNGSAGTCISIRQCQPLLNILLGPLSTESIQFLRLSQCGRGERSNDPKVCCELVGDDTNSLLPEVCGTDLSTRIVGGEIAELTEFPWMVLLEYDKRKWLLWDVKQNRRPPKKVRVQKSWNKTKFPVFFLILIFSAQQRWLNFPHCSRIINRHNFSFHFFFRV